MAANTVETAAAPLLPSLASLPPEQIQGDNPAATNPNSSSSSATSLASANLRNPLTPHELTFGERVEIYRRSVFSPLTFIGPAFGAGIGLWENEPAEWGQGMAGYGRRFGSSIGRTLSNKTIVFGIAAIDGEDPRYIPSEENGLLARSRHAVVSTFVSQRGDGSHMPAISVFAGAYGSAFIANTWYPPSKATTRHALEQGSSKLASTVGFHLLHEFWPDIRAKLHFHHSD